MLRHALTDDSVVVIIGSGAGGGTLANGLCQKGCKVVLLEAGKHQSPATFRNEEWWAFNQLAWLDKRSTSGTWQIAKDFPNLPAWICKTVGGTTVHWAGASLRIQEHEFKAKTNYSNIAGANLLDWPLTLAELEPYYAKAESMMNVTRTNDIPGLPGNNNFKVMYNGATRVGYKTVHTGRMAINSRPLDGRSACWQLGFCFQGCKSGAKWSTLYTEIPKAEANLKRGFAGGFEFETIPLGLPFTAAFLKPGAWGRDYTDLLEQYPNMAGMWIVGEDMPQETNAVTLHATEKDAFGLPIPNVHYDDHANDAAMRSYAFKPGPAIDDAVGPVKTIENPPYPWTHNPGTC